jgi:hypothetical protein
MKGWLMVGAGGLKRKSDLVRFVNAAMAFVATLPAK